MNDEMPWVNLTQEEVNDLRNKKFELTQYGKQKLRKMMNDNSTIDEMIEIAEEREAANRELEKDT
jgi:DNA-binding PadR family transcriptional regulator